MIDEFITQLVYEAKIIQKHIRIYNNMRYIILLLIDLQLQKKYIKPTIMKKKL